MPLSLRRIVQVAGGLGVVAGAVAWMTLGSSGAGLAGFALLVAGVLAAGAATAWPAGSPPDRAESDDITELDEDRQRELMRGTSLFLREMQYRYSVRLDTHPAGERSCFAAEVNSIRLGFIPAIVTDNNTDRQGYGFVAFVHDGNRWRGPGLPCPADQVEAVRHAARCVSPLAREDETRYDGESD